MYYKLDENKNAVPCSMKEWASQLEEMREKNKKHVDETTINGKWVSTVWLGLDHQFYETGKHPHIFETMIHDEKADKWMNYEERYSTWQEAEEGHKRAVQWVKDGCKKDEN